MNLNGKEYFYIRNVQNDVIGLHDTEGKIVVSYSYDTWGNIVSITGSLKDSVGKKNPYRYRGYRYDEETGLYYLQSRYYNAEWGRFINADAAIGKIGKLEGNNLFQYCFNNPVNMSDESGQWPKLSKIFKATAIVAACVAIVAACVVLAPAAAVAIVGGGVAVGAATAAAWTVSAIATGVAVASAAATIVSQSKERKSEKRYSVYHLIDKNTKQVKYVGRTCDVKKRRNAHKKAEDKKDLKMRVIAQNLSYAEARGIEQIEMVACHTRLFKNESGLNKINGIGIKNRNRQMYMAAAKACYSYWDNQLDNELLCWTE